MADPMPEIRGILGMPAELDQHTLDVAEKAVRDRIHTYWSSDARLSLWAAADAIHKLGGTR